MARSSSSVLVDTLALHGVDQFFCVPGESYLGFLDALYDDPKIRPITCRHEGGAAFMALADSKITGKPGVVFASRGPGSTNASIAIHTADVGATPLVCFFGQAPRTRYNQYASQEYDFERSFGHICRSVEQVNLPERLPEIVARAFHLAQTGTPGPVIVALPTDVLETDIDAEPMGPQTVWGAGPAQRDLDIVSKAIQEAERPIIIAGNETTSEGARRALVEFAEKYSLPVFPSYAHQHVMPHDHPCYAGEAGVRPPEGVKANAQAADLVLAIGTRITNKGSFTWSVPSKDQRLIHIYPDADMIGRVYPAEHGVVCTSESFLTAMSALNTPPPSDSRKNWLEKTHKGYTDTYTFTPRESSDGVEFGHVVQAMREQLAGDAIISVDVGSFASWLHQKFPFQKDQVLLAAESGAMGMGIPGAIAAAIRHPDRQVIALAGDGGALMTGSEMATAVKENANIVIFVSNNGQYGTIRVHQEVHHPSRTTGINELVSPDFASYAESFGAKGLRIRKPEDAAEVLAEALAHKGPVMVDVSSSLENISSGMTITELRAAE